MEQKTINTTKDPAVVYDFSGAQGFRSRTGAPLSEVADRLRDTALYLVNANWDEKKREELIYNMQVAATYVLDFFSYIKEREVEL